MFRRLSNLVNPFFALLTFKFFPFETRVKLKKRGKVFFEMGVHRGEGLYEKPHRGTEETVGNLFFLYFGEVFHIIPHRGELPIQRILLPCFFF